jgi:RNA polymerase sigma-70 factor (ECF subfamily)
MTAVSELFRNSYSSIVRFAYHSCRSVDLAEEFAQEAFVSYVRKVQGGADIGNPQAWILQTVRNQLNKHWRYRERHSETLVPGDECDRCGTRMAEPSWMEPRERNLTDYLSVLSEREEEVLLLRSKGMKYKEIAGHLGITTNSVGTLLIRAMRKIREAREKSETAVIRTAVCR